jgi:hypothetical protein
MIATAEARLFRLWSRFRVPLVFLALTLGAALVFALRLHTLLAYPYPPSNDAGGDLYSAQQWLGHAIPGVDVSLQPPLYYWLIVIPLARAFGPFLGPQIYMALVPALLVFPGYLVCRETRASVPSSVIGGVALAIAAPFSLMVSWNGGYNAFAIVFLTFFVALMARALRTGKTRDCVLAGVMFALVAATHELTFVVAALSLAFTSLVVVATSATRRLDARHLGLIIFTGAIACIPVLPLYLSSAGGAANLGVGGFQSQLNFAYTTFPFFAWGFQSTTLSGLALLDIFVASAGLVALWLQAPTRYSAIVLSSIWFGGLMIPFLSASNAVRGLYFLAIPAVLVVPSFLERLVLRDPADRSMDSRQTALFPVEPTTVTERPRGRARSRKHRLKEVTYRRVAVAAIAAFCVVNASFSLQTLDTATQYYLTLSPDNVAALNWLSTQTLPNATVYDSLGVEPWIWGYAHRLAYGPAPLGVESTSASLQVASEADAIWLGSSLMENSRLTVADNSPSPIGIPSVFVNVPGYWMQMISTQADLVNFTLQHSGVSYNEQLASGTLISNSSDVVGGHSVIATYQFWWSVPGFGVSEQLNLTGEALSVSWSGLNATLKSANSWLGLVPLDSLYGSVVDQPQVISASQIEDSYSLDGIPFTLTLTGGTVNQSVQPNGWAYVWCDGGSGWVAKFSGLPSYGNSVPAYVDTSALVRQLGIDYFTANPVSAYPMFLRLQNQAIGTAKVTQVFVSGDAYIFSVTWG